MRRDEVSVYSVKVVLAAAAALLWALIVVDPGLVVRFSGGPNGGADPLGSIRIPFAEKSQGQRRSDSEPREVAFQRLGSTIMTISRS
jgi:hypothetical protein